MTLQRSLRGEGRACAALLQMAAHISGEAGETQTPAQQEHSQEPTGVTNLIRGLHKSQWTLMGFCPDDGGRDDLRGALQTWTR